MPRRNQPIPRDTRRKTRNASSAASAPTTNDNRHSGAGRRASGGRKLAPAPKPAAQRATTPESLPELHSDAFRGVDAPRTLVPSTPFEPSTMPPPSLPVAARLTRMASPPAAATSSTQHSTGAQRSPKEHAFTPNDSVSERQETPPPGRKVILTVERANSGASSDSNLQSPEHLGEANSSDDDSPEPYIVYSEEATPTSFQLPLRTSVGPDVSYSLHHCQSPVRN